MKWGLSSQNRSASYMKHHSGVTLGSGRILEFWVAFLLSLSTDCLAMALYD